MKVTTIIKDKRMGTTIDCTVYCNKVSRIMSCTHNFACLAKMSESDLQFRYAVDMFKSNIWAKMMSQLVNSGKIDAFKTKFRRPCSDRAFDVEVTGESTADGFVLHINPLSQYVPHKVTPLKQSIRIANKSTEAKDDKCIKTLDIGGHIYKYRNSVLG